MKKTKSHGFTLVEFAVGAVLLAVGVLLLTVLFGQVFKTNRMDRQRGDLDNLLSNRLGLVKSTIGSLGGPTAFLRTFASSGGPSVFDPPIDTDPNSTFSTAFSNIPNPETISYHGIDYVISYQVSLQTVGFSSGAFSPSPISFSGAPIPLHKVGLIVFTATGTNQDPRQSMLPYAKELVLALP